MLAGGGFLFDRIRVCKRDITNMATVPDYSIGFTLEEVEAILTAQKAELKKTLASYTESGSQVVKRRIDDIHNVIAACQAALQKLDPSTYGADQNTSTSRVIGYLAR